jgi:hypothetical protein
MTSIPMPPDDRSTPGSHPEVPDEVDGKGWRGSEGKERYNRDVPGPAVKDGWAAPPLSELIVRSPDGDGTHPGPSPEDANRPGRVVAELLAVRGPAGHFLVPASSRRAAARSVLAYNRLRPLKVRVARSVIGAALWAGAAGRISESRDIVAPPDAAVLLEHLAAVLGEPRVVFAGTEKGGSGFVTPVLQLFSPDGRSIGFTKIGWDPVTTAMIHAEADALELAGRAGWKHVSVPEVAWRGSWEGLELLVTAPMPSTARRLRGSELPPIEPLHEVASLDGPLVRRRVTRSSYWTEAVATSVAATLAGRPQLAEHLERVERDHGCAELAFGRWHGDWVEWNLAEANGGLWAWDWAYSAAGIPFGLDLLQFFHLRHLVLREEAPDVALQYAAADAEPGLARLGIPSEERRAVIALHHTEVLLRDERARQARSDTDAAREARQ